MDRRFKLGDTYDINGTAVSFEIVKFYAAGINFHPEEGDHVKFDDLYLLVDPAEGHHEVGELSKGHYTMLNFKVGVLPEENDQTENDFTSRESDDPLSAQNPIHALELGYGIQVHPGRWVNRHRW